MRSLPPPTGAPPPLSRLGNLTGEVLPHVSSFLFFGIQLLAFVAQRAEQLLPSAFAPQAQQTQAFSLSAFCG